MAITYENVELCEGEYLLEVYKAKLVPLRKFIVGAPVIVHRQYHSTLGHIVKFDVNALNELLIVVEEAHTNMVSSIHPNMITLVSNS